MATIITFESYGQFLGNNNSGQNKGQFLSVANYLACVKKIAQTLGCTDEEFLNASLQQLKIWAIQIQDKPLYWTYSKRYRSDLAGGFNAFIVYRRFLLGLVSF